MVHPKFHTAILSATGATSCQEIEMVQSLWSGYGSIKRYALAGSKLSRVIIKHVQMPNQAHHPSGWNSDLAHLRKVKSYQVESAWYQRWQGLCDAACRTPQCYGLEQVEDEVLIILEDLDQAGFPVHLNQVSKGQLYACIRWLAHFHATFLGESPVGLWPTGTYWHLETRPDELDALEDGNLQAAAPLLDQKLKQSPFQTFVHGDAKLANFCFPPKGDQVAAVDIQYVGGGCGMKDLAYFIGSCLDEIQCEAQEQKLLAVYFDALQAALTLRPKEVDFSALEADWRALYPVAWADFHRFLKGWSPGHWKVNSYSERILSQVIDELRGT